MRLERCNKINSGIAATVALLLLLGTGVSVAGSDDPDGSSAEVQELKSEVNELKSEVKDLKGEVGTLRQQAAVGAPAAPAGGGAAPEPKTVGEHVGSIEKDLGDIKKNLTDNLGIHVHALVDTSYEYNLNQPNTTGFTKGGVNATATGGRTNQLRVFDLDANGWNLQQFNLHIDKSADGGVGFVSDINFGQVANVLRAATRNSNLNPGPTSNDIVDPTQMYLTYTVPVGSGINLQLGRFVTLLGEEVIPVYNNFNYNISRDIIFGFGIPFTHTGLRGQYAFNDKIGLTLGVNNGWDDLSDNNDGQTVEGQVALTPTPNISVLLNGIYGPEQVNHGNSKRWAIDPVATWKTPIKGLQLIGEYLYAQETGPVSIVPAVTSNGNYILGLPPNPTNMGVFQLNRQATWTGAAGYIVYDLTDNIEFATRGEWFRDSDGARTGLRQTLGEVTETINYKVPAVTGLLARFEFRHDESNQKPFFSNDGFTLAGVPLHTYSGQNTLLADVIYAF
jgi:hypothetical protein